MSAPYITHLTLSTGHARRSPRDEVGDDTLQLLVPWLRKAAATGERLPLPVAELAQYGLIAMASDGALIATVDAGVGVPLVTIGVAQRSRQAAGLWANLASIFDVPPGLSPPRAPWCAVALRPALLDHPQASEWLGDFERCLAWAWITRNPQLGSVR